MATLFVYHDLPSCSILRVWVYVSLASASFPRLSKRYVRCVTTMFFMRLDIQFSLVGNFNISIFIGWNFSISRSSRDTLSHWMAKWWGSTEVKSLICIPFSKMKYSVGWTVCLCPLMLVCVCVCVLCIGHHFFTIGQRARLEGMANAWFVAGKDPQNNTITVVCSSHS